MRTKISLLLLTFVLAVFMILSNSAFTQVKSVKFSNRTSTIKGEVIDLNCYLEDGAKATGDSHKDCAVMCAKAGAPLAILTSDGEIYIPVVSMGKNPNDKLMDFIAQQVEVTGKILQQGTQKGIKIESVKKAE